MATVTREKVQQYRDNPYVRAFLDTISSAEGTATLGDQEGYNIMFGNIPFESYDRHPNFAQKVGGTTTTAAGRYQITKPTYDDFANKLGITDFSPQSQDDIAIAILIQQNALDDVVNNNFDAAVNKLGNRWAALPSSIYGQPSRTYEYVRSAYDNALAGHLGESSTGAAIRAAYDNAGGIEIPGQGTSARFVTDIGMSGGNVVDRINQSNTPRLSLSGGPLTPDTLQQLVGQFPTPQPETPTTPIPVVPQSGVSILQSPYQYPSAVPSIDSSVPEAPADSVALTGGFTPEQYAQAVNFERGGQSLIAMPESEADNDLLAVARNSDARTRERLMYARQELDRINNRSRDELVSPYPTILDDEFLQLIDNINSQRRAG